MQKSKNRFYSTSPVPTYGTFLRFAFLFDKNTSRNIIPIESRSVTDTGYLCSHIGRLPVQITGSSRYL